MFRDKEVAMAVVKRAAERDMLRASTFLEIADICGKRTFFFEFFFALQLCQIQKRNFANIFINLNCCHKLPNFHFAI